MSFVLRAYQDAAVNSVYQYFMAGNSGNPLIALPTGTGKSLVIAELVRRALMAWPSQRFLLLTHDKELIKQDAAKILELWPQAPLGVYSAGLSRKETMQPIIVGGIGSVAKCPEKFGHRDLLIVDEAHKIAPNEETQYRKVIAALLAINPRLKVVGLSATIFRMKQGLLTEPGGIFTDVCFDATGIDAFNKFIRDGYLAPLVPRPTQTVMPVGGVSVRGGEFAPGELQKAVDRDEITRAACQETISYGQDRRSWLVYTTGVEHAEHTAEILRQLGVRAEALHSKIKPASRRDELIADFKSGKLQCLVTKDMLTTGFDHPPLDLIAVLRPTMSPGLWVQILGRGTRPCDEKLNCLVLDFAANTPRLGPINDPRIPRKPGKATGEMPIRICDACGIYNHASARFCGGGQSRDDGIAQGGCGHEFKFKVKFTEQASDAPLIKDETPKIEHFKVDCVWYHKHLKAGRNPSMKVTYVCGMTCFNEWVCFEHVGLPHKKAADWWRQHHESEVPTTVDAALAQTAQLRKPREITVNTNLKYPEVLSRSF